MSQGAGCYPTSASRHRSGGGSAHHHITQPRSSASEPQPPLLGLLSPYPPNGRPAPRPRPATGQGRPLTYAANSSGTLANLQHSQPVCYGRAAGRGGAGRDGGRRAGRGGRPRAEAREKGERSSVMHACRSSVYVWEAQGAGGWGVRASKEGCIYLGMAPATYL